MTRDTVEEVWVCFVICPSGDTNRKCLLLVSVRLYSQYNDYAPSVYGNKYMLIFLNGTYHKRLKQSKYNYRDLIYFEITTTHAVISQHHTSCNTVYVNTCGCGKPILENNKTHNNDKMNHLCTKNHLARSLTHTHKHTVGNCRKLLQQQEVSFKSHVSRSSTVSSYLLQSHTETSSIYQPVKNSPYPVKVTPRLQRRRNPTV